jgi:hypothetical protein
MRFVAFVVVVGLLGMGCETTKSIIVIPPCADRVETEGQATELSKRKFELDHTFDLPFSRTDVTMKTASGEERSFEIVDSQPDALRLFGGAALGVVGGLLLASAAYNVSAAGQGFFDPIPFYETLWGGGFVVLGVAGMSTGWHPPKRVFEMPADVCPASSRPSRAPKRNLAPRPRPPTSPPPAPLPDGGSSTGSGILER